MGVWESRIGIKTKKCIPVEVLGQGYTGGEEY